MSTTRRRVALTAVLIIYLLFGVWAFTLAHDRTFGLALFSAVSVVLWLVLRVLSPRSRNSAHEKKDTP